MSEEHKYMDESFKKMSEEYKATYNKSFWEDAKAQLENDALDNAFREAAAQYVPAGFTGLGVESLGDAFMDDAFREAAANVSVAYNQTFWQQMEAAEADLQMNDAFFDAAKSTKANYNPIYWGEADMALQNEGLHYEYQSAYWKEARELLDRADRKTFFTKWSAVAVVLLLFSFLGINSNEVSSFAGNGKSRENQGNSAEKMLANTQLENWSAADLESDLLVEDLDNTVTHAQDVVPNPNTHQPNNNLALDHEPEGVESENGNETIEGNEALDSDLVDPGQNETVNENETVSNTEVPQQNETVADPLVHDSNVDYTNEVVHESNLNHGQSRFNNGLTKPLTLASAKELNMDRMQQNNALLNPALLALPEFTLAEITPLKRLPVHTLAFIGGAGVGNSFGSDDLLLTRRVYGGLEYLRHGYGKLRQFEFGASLMVNYAKHDDFGVDSLVERFLDNGDVQRFWYKLQVHDLFYANANVLVNYRINTRHKVKFGVGIERLIGVQSNMAYKLNDDKGIQTVNNNWGVENGIKTMDMRFMLGYEYRLSNKFGVQLNASYGLFDRSDNSFYGGSGVFDNEMNITLGLKYNLFTRVK